MVYIYVFYNFIYFWLHWVFMLDGLFSSCGEQGLLIAQGSLVVESRIVACSLQ